VGTFDPVLFGTDLDSYADLAPSVRFAASGVIRPRVWLDDAWPLECDAEDRLFRVLFVVLPEPWVTFDRSVETIPA